VNLLVVGSVAFDNIETRAGEGKRLLGGSATYFSLAAAPFCTSRIVAVVGEDFTPEYEEVLTNRDIDIEGLQRAKGLTFAWGGTYSENFETRETQFTDLNVFADFSPELPASYRDSELVFLGNIQPSLQMDVLRQIDNPGLVAADTMNLWINDNREELLEVIRNIDILFINDEEAFLLTGRYPLLKAASMLLEMGPDRVVIKRGEHGAFLFGAGKNFYVPAFPLDDIVDPTGAGDSFAGAFMGYLAQEEELNDESFRKAMITASAVASYTCEGFGVEKLKRLTPEKVLSRSEEIQDLTSI